MTPDDRDPNPPAEPNSGATQTGTAVTAPERDEPPDETPTAAPAEEVKKRVESWVPELVKKAVAAGIGAVFTTEESIRRLTKEMPMPKEVAGYLVNTASSTKDEILRVFAREIREFLSSVNLSEEIAKMLTTLSFEIKTEIRFIPNQEKYTGVEPDVKSRVRLKRAEPAPRRRRFGRHGSGGGQSESTPDREPDEP